jgi:vanillate/3-O-methylgallate O-demethylase
VARVFESLLLPGPAYKLIRLPYSSYAYQQYDEVKTSSGRLVGYSTMAAYSSNESKLLSMVMIDLDHAQPGTELVLTWGEPNGGSRKPHVERHNQTQIRVTVAPAPFAEAVQRMKHAAVS